MTVFTVTGQWIIAKVSVAKGCSCETGKDIIWIQTSCIRKGLHLHHLWLTRRESKQTQCYCSSSSWTIVKQVELCVLLCTCFVVLLLLRFALWLLCEFGCGQRRRTGGAWKWHYRKEVKHNISPFIKLSFVLFYYSPLVHFVVLVVVRSLAIAQVI